VSTSRERTSPTATTRIGETGVLVIVRLPRPDGLDEVAAAVLRAGVHALEVTYNTPGALQWVSAATKRYGGELCIGVGTVRSSKDASVAIEAGAEFLVSPYLDLGVVEVASRHGLPAIPGALTPGEVAAASRAGAAMIKLFPAGLGGPNYLRDLLAPLDDVSLLPTGGVDESNAADFIAAGAAALSIGAAVVNETSVNERRFPEMTERLANIRRIVAASRAKLERRGPHS
jgi:2-dehydro-3-deoxyphosphogluconate aldolase/(4S)-4-hydroxy-2-oxoglutarate aldolase